MPIQKVSPEEILWSSIKVFRRKGYYRTTMADLAKEVELTKGAFYHHFTSKEEVMRKSLQSTANWFEQKVFAIAYLDDLPYQERWRQMTDKTYRAFTNQPGGCFFANTLLETAHVEDTFLEEIRHFFGLWEKALAYMFKEHYPAEALKDRVQQKIAEIEGAIVLMQLYQEASYLKKALERSVRVPE